MEIYGFAFLGGECYPIESVCPPALLGGGRTTIPITLFSWDICNSCSSYFDNAKLCSTLYSSVKSSSSFTSGTRKCLLLFSVCVCDPGLQPRPLSVRHCSITNSQTASLPWNRISNMKCQNSHLKTKTTLTWSHWTWIINLAHLSD